MDFDPWLKAVELAQKLYVLLGTLAKDAGWSAKKSKTPDLDRFYSVYLEDIHEGLKSTSSLYFRDFDAMRKELEGAKFIDPTPSVAEQLKARIDDSWFLKNEVREQAKAWLENLPPGSDERAYVWSVCNVFYRYTSPKASFDELAREADNIADSPKDAVLNTPNTRIADKIRRGELKGREEIKAAIDEEIESMVGCLKLAESTFQRLKAKYVGED